MPQQTPLERFLEDRKHALLSMDKDTILTYARAYGISMPQDDTTFWIAVHKARASARDLPEAARRESAQWLKARGLSGDIVPEA